MQRNPGFFHGKAPPTGCGVGGNIHTTQFGGHYAYGAAVATPPFGAAVTGTNHDHLPGPLDGIKFQPSEICPQNFIIFDQTENRSRVMFHPDLATKFSYPYDFNGCVDNACKGGKTREKNDENRDDICSHKEDTADIDALLSSDEDEEEDDDDDDTISTGRSPANWKGSPPYSSSSEDEEWNSSSSKKSLCSGASSSNGDGRKRARVRQMVKALRGIIPGGDSMDTPDVLDEAVKYLKSLKVEVKKLGVQNFENY